MLIAAWLIPAVVIIIAGLCMANIKLIVDGECSFEFFRDVFVAGLLWPIPLLAIVYMSVFFSKEQLKDIFGGFKL